MKCNHDHLRRSRAAFIAGTFGHFEWNPIEGEPPALWGHCKKCKSTLAFPAEAVEVQAEALAA